MTARSQFSAPVDVPTGTMATGPCCFNRDAKAAAGGSPLNAGRRSLDARIPAHEAGHCAAGKVLGQWMDGCTINFVNDGGRGHHSMTWSDADTDAERSVGDLCAALMQLMSGIGDDRSDIANELLHAHHQVIALLAGQIAEELLIGEVLPGSSYDPVDARSIAALIVRTPAALDAYLSHCEEEARGLLVEHQGVVRAIACALIQKCTIFGDEIDATIRESLTT